MTSTAHPTHDNVRAVTSEAIARPATVLDIFDTSVGRRCAQTAMRVRGADGRWQEITWAAYGKAVREVAAGLHALGVRPADRVAILSSNRPEWHVADFGVLAAGSVSVPVYPTSAGSQVAYILRHSGAFACFVDNEEQYAKILDHRDELLELRHVVMFDETTASPEKFLISMRELRLLGSTTLGSLGDVVDERRADVHPDDLATIVYTSGTTGPPKGAMLTHANLMATMRSITQVIELNERDRFLSFLPLSHITERCVSHFGLALSGGETWFARSITTVAEDLRSCRPTVFFAVPRVWEKFRDAILTHVDALDGWDRRLAQRYLSLAPARAAEVERGTRMPFFTRSEWNALDRFVGAKLRRAIGLDHARILSSGAAPIHPDLLRWFLGIGIAIAEGYGQTEVSLATSLNPPDHILIGTVGPPLPDVAVRIADDGEILVRGENVCAGYWRDESATDALVDRDGWLHSGDVGFLGPDGYLRVTDRKKDLIITAHGKNIAPQVIETELKMHPIVGHAVVVGDGRRYLTALISLDAEVAARWAEERHKDFSLEALAADPDVRAEVERAIDAVNANHARVETIRKWRLLPGELSISGGELTPTLKVRRKAVNEKYADVIEEMYAE